MKIDREKFKCAHENTLSIPLTTKNLRHTKTFLTTQNQNLIKKKIYLNFVKRPTFRALLS